MVTLTSQPETSGIDKYGYKLYVDAELVNEIFIGESSEHSDVGGDPLFLLGDIILCSRGSGSRTRYNFDGSIAFLGLWDNVLDPREIGLLYETVENIQRKSLPTPLRGGRRIPPPPTQERYTISGKECIFPFVYNNQNYMNCVQKPAGSEECYVGNDNWESCIVSGASLNLEAVEKRTTPGQPGSICFIDKMPGSNQGCSKMLECIPRSFQVCSLWSCGQ